MNIIGSTLRAGMHGRLKTDRDLKLQISNNGLNDLDVAAITTLTRLKRRAICVVLERGELQRREISGDVACLAVITPSSISGTS